MKQRAELVRGWRPGMPLLRWPRRPGGWRARSTSRGGRRPIRSLLATRRARLTILGVLGLSLLLGGGWLWFRDSSLVGVQEVTVTGETGSDSGVIRAALVSAARGMTTLDVQTDRLYTAISSYPVVKALEVSTQFPHGMRIRVVEEAPVAVITVAGRGVGVASDGTLLRDLNSLPTLPRIELSIPPGGPRLNEPLALNALAAANAAPRPLLSRIGRITTSPAHGLVAQLRDGPLVYLGDPASLEAKWRAVLAVLANAGSAGASYIDVTDPGRPAAGVAGGAADSASTAASSVTSTGAPETASGVTPYGSASTVAPSTASATSVGASSTGAASSVTPASGG